MSHDTTLEESFKIVYLLSNSVAANANGGFGVALNSSGGTLGPYLWSPFTATCLRAGVRFADMTGDGRSRPILMILNCHYVLTNLRDDYCCIAPNGDLYVWQNTAGSDARAPVWKELGLLKGGTGFPRERVRSFDCLYPFDVYRTWLTDRN